MSEIVAAVGFPADWRIGQTYSESQSVGEWSNLPENRQKPLIASDIQTEDWFVKDDNNAAFHSWIGVAMVASEEVFGLLNLESRTPNFYTAEQAALVQTFANQAGIAIEKAQLYQDALRAADRRAVLHRISQDIVRFNQDPNKSILPFVSRTQVDVL
jgi:GAF domain-containing protein